MVSPSRPSRGRYVALRAELVRPDGYPVFGPSPRGSRGVTSRRRRTVLRACPVAVPGKRPGGERSVYNEPIVMRPSARELAVPATVRAGSARGKFHLLISRFTPWHGMGGRPGQLVAHGHMTVRTCRGPHDAHPPLIVDAHAPLSSPVTPERFKPIARQRTHEIQRLGRVQHRELASCDRLDGAEALRMSTREPGLRILAAEPPNDLARLLCSTEYD